MRWKWYKQTNIRNNQNPDYSCNLNCKTIGNCNSCPVIHEHYRENLFITKNPWTKGIMGRLNFETPRVAAYRNTKEFDLFKLLDDEEELEKFCDAMGVDEANKQAIKYQQKTWQMIDKAILGKE